MSKSKANKITLKEIGMALFCGLLTGLAFPKFSFIFPAWISLLLLFNLITKKKPGQSFLLGLISGSAFYAILLYWIPAVPKHYGHLSSVLSLLIFLLMIILLASFWGGFSLFTSIISNRYPRGIFFLIPFLWIAFEYLITHLFTGFPWGLLGYSQHPNLCFIQIASVFGVYGISFVLILFQSLFLFSLRYKKRWPFFCVLALVLFIHTAGFFTIQNPVKKGKSFHTSMIQGNTSANIDWSAISNQEKRQIFNRYLDLSKQSSQNTSGLIIWPEFSVPMTFSYPYGLYKEFIDQCYTFVSETGNTLLLGTNEIKQSEENLIYFNSSMVLHPDLTVSQDNKRHLVPFGEYTPYRNLFSFIKRITNAIGELTPGKTFQLHRYKNISFGAPICYEIIFPNLVRKFVKKGAQFLVTITNDGWYGTSAAPFQHFSIAVFRAVENRRFLLRAATTGISGIIDPYGRILSKTELNTQTYLSSEIYTVQGNTFYTRFGDTLPFFSLTLTVLFFILAILKKRHE